MITPEYSIYPNIIQITTLDLRRKGVPDPIHIMYIWFDPMNEFSTYNPPEYCSNFSFSIQSSGLFRPTFKPSVLSISLESQKYFDEGYRKYLSLRNTKNFNTLIEFPKEPEWWQDDDTPLNSKNESMKFICQLDIGKIFNDDCRMFVFYDKTDKVVRYIYQRD